LKFDAIFLDRDGTISHDPYGYINDVKDYDFFDFTFEALELLHQYSDKFFIVTNQSGLSTSKITSIIWKVFMLTLMMSSEKENYL